MTISLDSGGGYTGVSWKGSSETSIHNIINTSACTLYAPLKSSLILSKGTGDPTWSRATKAWGFNELGYLEELASGCAFFGGARLVRNLLAATEDASSGSWSKSTGTTAAQATDSSGGSTALRFTYGSTQSYLMRQNVSTASRSATYCLQVRFKTDATHDWWRAMIYDGSGNQCRVWFNAQTGAIGNSAPGNGGVFGSVTITDEGGGWFALRLTGSPGVAGAGVYAQFSAADGDGNTSYSSADSGDAITIEKPSLVDVTGYDVSYVPEYVSVGVEASPYFGAGIDGAKYFSTDYTGGRALTNLIGFRREAAATNNLLHSRDLSNAAWSTKTNITAAETATGLDGIANTATTLTATAADAIILQPITLASADRCASAYVKRRTGTGAISFTQDGGSTWTDITSQINSNTWSRVQITSTLANPSVGFKISTSGDAIDVDCVQNEAGAVATSPIVTTTATVTRNEDSLTYQTASNIDFAAGTIFAELKCPGSAVSRFAVEVGSATFQLSATDANTDFRAYDTTLTAIKTGMSDITTGRRKRAVSWGPAGLSVTGDGLSPVTVGFDGSYGSGATVSIGRNINGYIGPVAIYNYQMTNAELQAITS